LPDLRGKKIDGIFASMKIHYSKKAVKALGKKIRETRIKQKISQDQLAFEIGTTQKQISRIERGEINTSIAHILAIAAILNVHVKELWDFKY
jgi:transcriptional regulator with XRE-family HTH domain